MLLDKLQTRLDESSIPSGIIYGPEGPVLRATQDLPNGWQFRVHVRADRDGVLIVGHPWHEGKNPDGRVAQLGAPLAETAGFPEEAVLESLAAAVEAMFQLAPDTFGRMPADWTPGEIN